MGSKRPSKFVLLYRPDRYRHTLKLFELLLWSRNMLEPSPWCVEDSPIWIVVLCYLRRVYNARRFWNRIPLASSVEEIFWYLFYIFLCQLKKLLFLFGGLYPCCNLRSVVLKYHRRSNLNCLNMTAGFNFVTVNVHVTCLVREDFFFWIVYFISGTLVVKFGLDWFFDELSAKFKGTELALNPSIDDSTNYSAIAVDPVEHSH